MVPPHPNPLPRLRARGRGPCLYKALLFHMGNTKPYLRITALSCLLAGPICRQCDQAWRQRRLEWWARDQRSRAIVHSPRHESKISVARDLPSRAHQRAVLRTHFATWPHRQADFRSRLRSPVRLRWRCHLTPPVLNYAHGASRINTFPQAADRRVPERSRFATEREA